MCNMWIFSNQFDLKDVTKGNHSGYFGSEKKPIKLKSLPVYYKFEEVLNYLKKI